MPKKYGHTWHRMSFLRPGVIIQHRPEPCKVGTQHTTVLCDWSNYVTRLLLHKPAAKYRIWEILKLLLSLYLCIIILVCLYSNISCMWTCQKVCSYVWYVPTWYSLISNYPRKEAWFLFCPPHSFLFGEINAFKPANPCNIPLNFSHTGSKIRW